MKLPYLIVAAALGVIFMIIKAAFPTIPLSDEAFVALVVWIIAQLGVEVVGFPLAFRVYRWQEDRKLANQYFPEAVADLPPKMKKSKK